MSMEQNSTIETFCGECNIADTGEFVTKCRELYLLLSAANQEVNLTRIETEPDYWVRHIADSISIAKFFPYLATEHFKVADIGCGAGFPALPLATAFPGLHLTAIDSIAKKTDFVRQAATRMALNNIEIVTARSREMSRQVDWQERFDIITARAVSDARTIFRENRRLIKSDGQFILYKTPEQAAAEIDDLKKASVQYGFVWSISAAFELPCNGGHRVFLYSHRKD